MGAAGCLLLAVGDRLLISQSVRSIAVTSVDAVTVNTDQLIKAIILLVLCIINKMKKAT